MQLDYEFNTQSNMWDKLSNTQCINNLPLLLRWSPYSTEAELLKQVSGKFRQYVFLSLFFLSNSCSSFPFCLSSWCLITLPGIVLFHARKFSFKLIVDILILKERCWSFLSFYPFISSISLASLMTLANMAQRS